MSPKKVIQRLLLVTIALGAVTTACSLVVSNDTAQCTTDGDCRSFGTSAVCRANVCVSTTVAAADGGPGACISKAPTSQLDILNNPCTSSVCDNTTRFDNCARLGLCNDAGLPALILPGDGGVR